MQLAMEAPTSYLPYISLLGDFDWVLTNVALKDQKYLNFYKEQKKQERVVVVDSGVNEEGFPRSIKEMDKIVREIDADFIIPPDVLGNKKKTLELLNDSIVLWGSEKLIPVLQGKDIPDVEDCLYFMRIRGFTKFCVPYDITNCDALSREKISLVDHAHTRYRVVKFIVRTYPDVEGLHLLGLTTLEEVVWYLREGLKIVSIDTGSPVLNALHTKRFGVDNLVPKGLYLDYEEKVLFPRDLDRLSRCYWNIAVLRRVMSSGSEFRNQIFVKERAKNVVG